MVCLLVLVDMICLVAQQELYPEARRLNDFAAFWKGGRRARLHRDDLAPHLEIVTSHLCHMCITLYHYIDGLKLIYPYITLEDSRHVWDDGPGPSCEAIRLGGCDRGLRGGVRGRLRPVDDGIEQHIHVQGCIMIYDI